MDWKSVNWPTIVLAVIIMVFFFGWIKFDMHAMESRLTKAIEENRELIIKYIAKDPKLSSSSP